MPLTVEDLEVSDAEGRCHLVLDDLHAGIVPDDLVAILKLADTTDVQTHGGVELQGVTTRSRFGGAVGIPTDLLSELVDEDTGGIGLADSPRDLTQGLRHEAGLQTYLRLTHIALDLLLRHQGSTESMMTRSTHQSG